MHSSRAGKLRLSSPSLSLHAVPSPSLPLSLPPPAHKSTSVLLSRARTPFVCSAGAPTRALPRLSGQNRGDGVIRRLPGGCQLVLGRADRVAAWWMFVHARIPAPPHTHTYTHGHLLRVCVCVCVEKAAEFCQWLHLNPPSPRLGISARPCLY